MKLHLDRIRVNSWNCNHMGETEREALKQRLMIQDPNTIDPITVRLMPDDTYEIVDGEHRWRIAQELSWSEIEVFVIDIIDDLEAKVRCISNSKLRGHVNWFILAKVLKQDFETGVNLTEAYKNILSEKEIEELFTLDNLVPKARLDLEEAIKKFPTIPLYDLYMIAQFPTHLQEQIAEEYKTHPIASHALARTLNKYTKQTQPTTNNNQPRHQLSEETNSQINNLPEKLVNPLNPNDTLRKLNIQKQQQYETTHPKSTQQNPTNKPHNSSEGNSSETDLSNNNYIKFHASWSESEFCCECGHLYRARSKDRMSIKNLELVVQNKNLIFEHIDLNPRTFLIHCDNCSSDQEIRVNTTEESVESVAIFCRHCSPTREGVLDIVTGDAMWFG
ncbi:MAG: ParB N-terminal domain-containing protein [Nitrososphaerota archaeon]|nr:ParB N-terminal domain-containing protein [Nitrososphaerota archaeon]